jgi:ATP/ADP translocase
MCRLSNFNLLFLLLFGTFWYTLGTSRTPDQKFAQKSQKKYPKNLKKSIPV